jgi:hypothetical protein
MPLIVCRPKVCTTIASEGGPTRFRDNAGRIWGSGAAAAAREGYVPGEARRGCGHPPDLRWRRGARAPQHRPGQRRPDCRCAFRRTGHPDERSQRRSCSAKKRAGRCVSSSRAPKRVLPTSARQLLTVGRTPLRKRKRRQGTGDSRRAFDLVSTPQTVGRGSELVARSLLTPSAFSIPARLGSKGTPGQLIRQSPSQGRSPMSP